MSYIEILPAYHGDAFIIHAMRGDNSGIIVVDGGPGQSRIKVLRSLEELDKIDLMVLTHFDSDHITGLITYLEQHTDPENFNVKELWVNCAREIDIREDDNVSYGQANKMADLLSTLDKNKTGGIIWKENICAGLTKDFGFATVTVIGPETDILAIRQEKYEAAIDNNVSLVRTNSDGIEPLEDLAHNRKKAPSISAKNELANMASIAFLIECDGLKALMLGDSYPDTIEKELRKKYSENNPLRVDVIKVSHHGSRNNISNSLLDIVDCQDYIISTNGGAGDSMHPDRETIANILCHPQRDRNKTVRLYFNYDFNEILKRTGTLLTEEERCAYNCEITPPVTRYPI